MASGFIGTTFILLLCLLLDIYLCKIAYATKNKKDRFVVIGIIAMLLYQQLQNTGMIVGLLPITGITLPLISYGGSSILSLLHFIRNYFKHFTGNKKNDSFESFKKT